MLFGSAVACFVVVVFVACYGCFVIPPCCCCCYCIAIYVVDYMCMCVCMHACLIIIAVVVAGYASVACCCCCCVLPIRLGLLFVAMSHLVLFGNSARKQQEN